MGDQGSRIQVYPSFRFVVKVGDNGKAAFTECTLPTIELEVEEIKEGGLNFLTHQLPGRRKAARVTLKNGIGNRELLDWYFAALNETLPPPKKKKPLRRPVTITLFNSECTALMEWKIEDALPVKWAGPQLKTADTALAIQTLELACGRVTVTYHGKQ